MKKFYRILIINVLSIIILWFTANITISLADVGSFEDYDSGSDWGDSSDWGGSSWSSSDWGSSSSRDYSSSGFGFNHSSGGGSLRIGEFFMILIVLAPFIIMGVLFSIIKYMQNGDRMYKRMQSPYYPRKNQEREVKISDTLTANQIQQFDPLFNKEEFLSFAKNVFIKLQEAWMDRDWSAVRMFETTELFERHQRQLQGYIDRHQINMLEKICIESAYLKSFRFSGDKEILRVLINSKMIDYIIDENTGNIIKGDTTTERHNTYELTFIRTEGMKTNDENSGVKTTNCPNCGAPIKITSSGKCEYCGSVVTTGKYDWVLSNLSLGGRSYK